MNGNRSGGTAAANVMDTDKVHSDITNLVGSLMGSSADKLTSTGSNLLGQGIQGTRAAFGDAGQLQQQRAAMWNDIAKSSAQVAAGVVGGLPGAAGGWQDQVSNALGGQ